jgi:hexokinase
VARRAALLSGMAVAAVLVQTGRANLPGEPKVDVKSEKEERISVGVDGRYLLFSICCIPRHSVMVRWLTWPCSSM